MNGSRLKTGKPTPLSSPRMAPRSPRMAPRRYDNERDLSSPTPEPEDDDTSDEEMPMKSYVEQGVGEPPPDAGLATVEGHEGLDPSSPTAAVLVEEKAEAKGYTA